MRKFIAGFIVAALVFDSRFLQAVVRATVEKLTEETKKP